MDVSKNPLKHITEHQNSLEIVAKIIGKFSFQKLSKL